jgi:hypothetical protein
MECPHCGLEFQPFLSSHYMGLNGKKQFCHIVWQLCPRCQEFVVCLKKLNEPSDLILQVDDSEILMYRAKHSKKKIKKKQI